MTQRFTRIVFLAMIGSSLALVACAGSPRPSSQGAERGPPISEQVFDRLDVDRNNIVTFEEIEASRIRAFERIDENSDGIISSSEMEALDNRGLAEAEVFSRGRNGRIRSDRLFRMDRNRDGRISLNEFDGLHGSILDRADFNGDGDVDRAEFDDMMVRMRASRRR